MSKKKNVFSTSDFYGNVVTLTTSSWTGHILAGHQEMVGTEQLVQTTVKDPHEIRLSTQYSTSLAFYSSPGAGGHAEGIRVLVDYVDVHYEKGASEGKITTAYPIDTVKYAYPHLFKTIYKKGGK